MDRVRQRLRRRYWEPNLALGRDGEDYAHRFIERRGLKVVCRNYKTRSGSAEVDLVAHDGENLIFIEVKTRASNQYGAPDRAIDWDKRRKIIRAAREYVRKIDWDPGRVRFDVVEVIWEPGHKPEISHTPDAFRGERYNERSFA
jgi:putative endonuclease